MTKPLRLWDTHCHVDAFAEPLRVLQEATVAGIGVVAVTEDPGHYRLLRARLGNRPGVQVALGFHPLRVSSGSIREIDRFLRQLPHATWIGEVGLDFSRAGRETRDHQLRVFDALLAEAQVRARPLTVHSRGAHNEVVDRLIDAGARRVVLHWYTGSIAAAELGIDGGFYFSINPAMLRSQRIAAVLSRLPRDRVLLESDGPYATDRGQSVEPATLPRALEQLARRWDCALSEVEDTLRTNYRQLLDRPADNAPS